MNRTYAQQEKELGRACPIFEVTEKLMKNISFLTYVNRLIINGLVDDVPFIIVSFISKFASRI